VPRGAAGGRRLQHRRRARVELLDAGGDRAVRADRRPRAGLGPRPGAADRRPPVVDQRPGRVPGRLSRVAPRVRRRGDPARDPPAERRPVDDRASLTSVVVVTFNALPWLERCLESVRGHETIVVDHGSTDGTVELVRDRFPEAKLVEQENRGFGGGNNTGLLAASGRYVLLLNSDAWAVGDAVERLVAFADEHPDAAIVGPRLRNPDGTLQRSVRGDPTLWAVATEYLFLRQLAPWAPRPRPLPAR